MESNINVGRGRLLVDNNSVRIQLPYDFCRYYLWHISKQPWMPFGLSMPKHGAHITIISKDIHKINTSSLRHLNGRVVEFIYDLEIRKGGRDFTNYWMAVECPFAKELKQNLGLKDPKDFKGLHITICNNKQHVGYTKKN